jgi:glutamate--cysteine ligase
MSRQVAEDDTPIENPSQLRDYILQGAKPRDRWGHGIEYERIGVFRDSGETVPFAGHPSVQSVLRSLGERGWELIEEDGTVVELARGGAAVSLEPGSQLEFAGPVHKHLEPLRDELCDFLAQTESASESHGISWLALGLNPFTPIERIGWIPKKRYRIMSRRLARRGKLAHYMMKGTAGIQGNFDFESEQDAMVKLRLAMGVTSFTTALLANSPLYAGVPNQFRSMRAFIWLDTDPDRCGLLELAFREPAGVQAYVDWALPVPLLFIVRQGRWIDMEGYTFARFLSEGREDFRATTADWALHLTTLFPEVRLKQYLEVRGADSVPPDLAVALMAFWKGLLYAPSAGEQAWRLVENLSWSERQQLHRDVCVAGLGASLRNRAVADVARDLLQVAAEGLQELRDEGGSPDESGLLAPLLEIVEDPVRCPAARLLEHWNGAWGGDRARLVDYASRTSLGCS